MCVDSSCARTPQRRRQVVVWHIEFECPFDPSQVGMSQHEGWESAARATSKRLAKRLTRPATRDQRFAALVADSGVVYEVVHRYGMGALLVATAGRSGDLSWL